MMTPRPRTRPFGYALLLCGLMVGPGCAPTQSRPHASFHAPDTPSRVPAIVEAADAEDGRTLAELVHALTDEDAAVRMFAIQSLRERTGETLGYRYYDGLDQRREAVRRWHNWLAGQGIAPIPAAPDAPSIADP